MAHAIAASNVAVFQGWFADSPEQSMHVAAEKQWR